MDSPSLCYFVYKSESIQYQGLLNETEQQAWFDDFSVRNALPTIVQATHGAFPEWRSESGIPGDWS